MRKVETLDIDLMTTAEVYEHLGVVETQFRQYTSDKGVQRACGAHKRPGCGPAYWWPPDGVALLSKIAAEHEAGVISPGNVHIHLERIQRLSDTSQTKVESSVGADSDVHMLNVERSDEHALIEVMRRQSEHQGDLIPIARAIASLFEGVAEPALSRLDRIATALEKADKDRLLTQKEAHVEYGLPYWRIRQIRREVQEEGKRRRYGVLESDVQGVLEEIKRGVR